MNKLIFVVLILISSYTCTGNNSELADNNSALAEIKKEPKVKDAIITDTGVLYAGVDDDGTNRNGYAEYLCQVLKSKQAKANRVKVVKHNSQNDPKRDNAYGILLGESWCK